MADDVKTAEKAVEAAADALVQDVITTVRQHPQYASLVNSLTDKTIQTLTESI